MSSSEVGPLGWVLLVLAFGTVVRSVALAGVCGSFDWLLRTKTAELRFALWRWLLLALFALPVLLLVTPRLDRASSALDRAGVILSSASSVDSRAHTAHPVKATKVFVTHHSRSVWWMLPFIFYAGATTLLLARLTGALARLARMARASEGITNLDFREVAHEIWLQSGAWLKPRIAISGEVSVPITFEPVASDLDEPWILLPASWQQWDRAKLRAVLMHEMIHVRRRDSSTALLASLATCLFWFNPLSWFLQRRLSALAEQACDEQTLTTVETPEAYAEMLVDFASEVGARGGRILAGASAVVQHSPIKRRIERLFVDTRRLRKGRRLTSVLIAMFFLPALYLAAAARFEQPHQATVKIDAHLADDWNQGPSTTPEQAAELQSSLQADPDNLETRTRLLFYYRQHREASKFIDQVLWFVQHHPESQALQLSDFPHRSPNYVFASPADIQRLAAAWEQAIAAASNSADVLFNAARFFQQEDPERGLSLLRQAQELDSARPERYAHAIATIYDAAEIALLRPNDHISIDLMELSPQVASKLDAELQQSDDPALLSRVGSMLASMNFRNSATQQQRALELIQKAIDIDPANPAWQQALASAKAGPGRPPAPLALPAGTVRLSEKLLDPNLLEKADPVYPPLALQARIQGTVEFTATIGTDGHIEKLQLVRGHPLLVNAAKDAVLKRVYRPTLLNGKPVAVMTEVLVPFQLPQQ